MQPRHISGIVITKQQHTNHLYVPLMSGSSVDWKVAEGSSVDWSALKLPGMMQELIVMISKGQDLSRICDEKTNATPLHFFAWEGDPLGMNMLVERGVPVDPKDINGWTPLLDAVRSNKEEAVNILLTKRASASVQATSGLANGWTALHFAVQNCGHKVLQMLLDAGADSRLVNNRGETPIDLANRLIIESQTLPYQRDGTFLITMIKKNTTERREAFAMGKHPRLGAETRVLNLDDGVVRMILELL